MIEMFESIKIIEQSVAELLGQTNRQNNYKACSMNTCFVEANLNYDTLFDCNLYNFYYDSKFSMEELIFFFLGNTVMVMMSPPGQFIRLLKPLKARLVFS